MKEFGKITIGGEDFFVESATLSPSVDSIFNFDLEVVCHERRVKKFEDEICDPYLKIESLKLEGCQGNVSDIWDRDEIDRINQTYFALFGESFSILSAKVSFFISKTGEKKIELIGKSDLILDDASEFISIDLSAIVSVV